MAKDQPARKSRPDMDRVPSDDETWAGSEQRYRLLVEGATDYAIFMLDPKGHVVSWNAGAERIKGYRTEEILGKHFSAFYPPEDLDKPSYELKVAEAEGRFEDEGWRLRKDGSRFWANVVITPMIDPSGRLVGFSKITRDLTERKEAEEKIRKLNTELEQRVRERTSELEAANQELKREVAVRQRAEERLRDLIIELNQEKKQAEEASRLKSQFISNVSHELRTPLNAILGYSALLIDEAYGPLGGEQREPVEGIRRNADDLLILVTNVLDLAKIESGKTSLNLATVQLSPLMNEVVAGLRPFLDAKSLPVKWEIEANLPAIESDANKIKQIAVNLLSNAIKFTQKGSITIGAENRPEKWGVEFYVRDTGVGIPADEAPKIFKRFHQVDATSTREFGGIGLGLAIVKELVEILKGEVRLESVYGEGSTFTVFLPYRIPPAL